MYSNNTQQRTQHYRVYSNMSRDWHFIYDKYLLSLPYIYYTIWLYLLYKFYLNHSLLESDSSSFFAFGILGFYTDPLEDALFCFVIDFFLGFDFFLEFCESID